MMEAQEQPQRRAAGLNPDVHIAGQQPPRVHRVLGAPIITNSGWFMWLDLVLRSKDNACCKSH